MRKFRVFGERSPECSVVENENRLLAREAAAEGFVLLENRGVLPLKNKRVTLYGAGARMTIKGGSGSGDVHERYSVNIEDGLINNGFAVTHTSWLERFTEQYARDQKAFHEHVETAIGGYPVWKVMDMFRKIGEYTLAYPLGDEIVPDDLTGETDTAIYVVARQAGEGADRTLDKGDFLLSDLEIANIRRCAEHYENFVLILNVGGLMDLSPLDGLNVGAIVYYGQAGEEGGNALGEIFAGKVTPSGKLTDTWAKSYSDYPTAKTHGQRTLDENYTEGIYVGYRWFDANGIASRYPFGYGLSYTEFEQKVRGVSVEGSTVRVSVAVQNTGKRYAGKDVVQCYLAKPGVKYDVERLSLAAFHKTKLLLPGETDEVTLVFDIRDSAVYDETHGAFVLEAGYYGVHIGSDVRSNEACAVLKVMHEAVTERCRNLCGKRGEFADFKPNVHTNVYPAELPILIISNFESKEHNYIRVVPNFGERIRRTLETLTDTELALFAMGGGYFTKLYNKAEGACGNTTSRLVQKGIPNILMADGPAGINLLQKIAYTRSGAIRFIDELPKEWQWGWLKKIVPHLKFLFAKDRHTKVYQYCTAWPNATTLAQTWNTSLVELVGAGVGKEMRTMGVTLWLAPALNIHRDPLCGRNFEYYSEDPIISGMMAAAMTRGVQNIGGVGVTVKHFACNNREDDRMKVSSNLSERALREIYLKGFRIAVEAEPWALMSSYNRINGKYAPNSPELLIDILRCEWGYEGLVMSDWDAMEQCDYVTAVKSGNNMIMPGSKKVAKALKQAVDSDMLTRGDLLPGAVYALRIIMSAATSQEVQK
jgi:beta-glucosidase